MSQNRTMRVALAAFSVLLFFSTVGAECPAELVKPCICVKIYFPNNVQCTNFTDLHALQAVFDRSVDYPFDHFILQESQVMYLNATWLTTKTIQHITVENSTLTSLFDRIPDPVEMVSIINLVNVKVLRGMEWEQFQPLNHLLELNMEGVEVRKLGRSLGENMSPTFRDFRLWRGKTSQLDDDVFQGLTRLRTIEIRQAEVKEIKRSMFARPSKLFTFDFSYNQIEIIPDDIFDEMPEISNVLLMGNKIKTLPESACQGFFYLVENPVLCDCKMAWLSSRSCVIYGTCDAPDTMKGKNLNQLKEEDFSYCRK